MWTCRFSFNCLYIHHDCNLQVLGGLYAALNYNVGASDFKETPAYKESVQSQEFLEQSEASDSDVFESNPTEVAPSLE